MLTCSKYPLKPFLTFLWSNQNKIIITIPTLSFFFSKNVQKRCEHARCMTVSVLDVVYACIRPKSQTKSVKTPPPPPGDENHHIPTQLISTLNSRLNSTEMKLSFIDFEIKEEINCKVGIYTIDIMSVQELIYNYETNL